MNLLIRLFLTFRKIAEKEHNQIYGLIECFEYFLRLFVEPIYFDNIIIKHRQIIRSSKKLNKLLYSNSEGLVRAFNHAKKMDPNDPRL